MTQAPPLAPRRDVAYVVVLTSSGAHAPGTTFEVLDSLSPAERLTLTRTAAGDFVARFGNSDRPTVRLPRGEPRVLASPQLTLLLWHGEPTDPVFVEAVRAHDLRSTGKGT